MRVTANSATCAVSSLCVYRVPGVFDQDEDGLVLVLDESPAEALHEDIRRAARGCPTKSIRVIEETAAREPAAAVKPPVSP
jgi:ferredoxin